MISKENLKEILVEQKKMFLDTKNSFDREILSRIEEIVFKTQEALIITGIRRCGKSYLMRLIWKMIRHKKNLIDDQALYINFEDERLSELRSSELNLILESYLEIFNPKQGTLYLFFDEIQNVKNWERFINRLRESKKYKIFITGSNASLLSEEIATHLTGRTISLNLYPLSFKEYVKVKMKDFDARRIYDAGDKVKIKKLFNQYLRQGGFPEVIISGYLPLLQEYFRDILYRDIVARYRIKYKAGLKEIVNFLISNIARSVSLQKIAKMTKIKNINTAKNYLDHLENSYLFYFLPMYSYSVKRQIYNPDKVYIADLGLYSELSFKFSRNQGAVLENFVFNELKRRHSHIFYGLDKKYGEVDFVVAEKNKIKLLIQACFILSNEETKRRELRSLLKAIEEYKLKEGLVITNDYEGEEIHDNRKIFFIPAWKYFLL